MFDQAVEQAAGAGGVVRVHLEPGVDVRADQPRPDGALMVGGVARPQVAVVAGLVIGVARRQRPQADRRQQPLANDVEHRRPPLGVEDRVGQGDGEDLVRPASRVVAVFAVHDVVNVAAGRVPEAVVK